MTTGGSTSGRWTRAESRLRPGKRPRARSQAARTPGGRATRVETTATRSDSSTAAVSTGVKAGQDKIDEQKLRKKLGELKEELGGVVYAQKSGTTPEGVDAEVEITRIVAEINAVEAELASEGEADGESDAAAEAG